MPQTGSEKRLTDWIAPETWHSGNPLDNRRFFRFVNALWLERQSLVNEESLREQIAVEVKKHHPNFDQELAENLIEEYVGHVQLILDYSLSMTDGV